MDQEAEEKSEKLVHVIMINILAEMLKSFGFVSEIIFFVWKCLMVSTISLKTLNERNLF